MSGGIDSSFAAVLLREQGFKVIGVTFQLLPAIINKTVNPNVCCSHETIYRAQNVAAKLSIPHHIIDLRKEFEEHVIERFIGEYRSGKTPNPCILCNRHIKFSSFIKKVHEMGGEKIATGHYAVVEQISNGYHLKKGKDHTKDQSYFLYPIKKESLRHIRFPLGEYTKKNVREHVLRIRPALNKTSESQDICFIPDGNYRDFLNPFVPLKKGPIYLFDGTFLGYHNGIHLYTIGQRRSLNVPYKMPLYVLEIKPEENTIIVGPRERLARRSLIAKEINFFDSSLGEGTAKTRYRQKEIPCVFTLSGDAVKVDFTNPVHSITPGQSVVLYDKERVIGGGIIETSTE